MKLQILSTVLMLVLLLAFWSAGCKQETTETMETPQVTTPPASPVEEPMEPSMTEEESPAPEVIVITEPVEVIEEDMEEPSEGMDMGETGESGMGEERPME